MPANPVEQASTTGSGGGIRIALAAAPRTFAITTAGDYPTVPANPVAQDTTSGTGTGATATATWEIFEGAIEKTVTHDI